MDRNIGIVILAAGSGKRLGAALPKPLVPIWGKPMIAHLLDQVPSSIQPHIIISPKDLSIFESHIGKQRYLFQTEPSGTAMAIRENTEYLSLYSHLVILNGDTPFVPRDLINQLIKSTHDHIIVCFKPSNASSYGQVVVESTFATKIVEAKDRTQDISDLCYSGIMKCHQDRLKALHSLPSSKVTQEYYITDLISPERQFKVIEYPSHFLHGINTPEELISVAQEFHQARYRDYLKKGVFFQDYNRVTVHPSVTIDKHCYIGADVSLLGNTNIGSYTRIHQGSIIDSSTIGKYSTLKSHTLIVDSTCMDHTTLGPFAHICEQSIIQHHAHIGNFVEVKRSNIGPYTKAKHLSYLGDTQTGEHCNIGAGVITCNYVPWIKEKQSTKIAEYAFIGAGSLLIAPLEIGRKSLCAAGSIITKPVPEKHLAISRPNLIVKAKSFAHMWGD